MPGTTRSLRVLTAAMLSLAATPAASQVADPWQVCAQAAAEQERVGGLPDGVLAAVGRVESGRTNPVSGQRVPWPFSVNVDGAGRWFEGGAEAVAYVQAALAGRARSIDVGCFQVNLQYHPTAFASLVEAFDPGLNAAYAARLLGRHFAAAGTWDAAVGRYHSMTPGLGDAYAARVMAEWQGRPGPELRMAPSRPAGIPVVWRPGAPSLETRLRVRVFIPGGGSR